MSPNKLGACKCYLVVFVLKTETEDKEIKRKLKTKADKLGDAHLDHPFWHQLFLMRICLHLPASGLHHFACVPLIFFFFFPLESLERVE
jgi:hypothetical protein